MAEQLWCGDAVIPRKCFSEGVREIFIQTQLIPSLSLSLFRSHSTYNQCNYFKPESVPACTGRKPLDQKRNTNTFIRTGTFPVSDFMCVGENYSPWNTRSTQSNIFSHITKRRCFSHDGLTFKLIKSMTDFYTCLDRKYFYYWQHRVEKSQDHMRKPCISH